jgi:hypothetical protein
MQQQPGLLPLLLAPLQQRKLLLVLLVLLLLMVAATATGAQTGCSVGRMSCLLS